MPLARLPMSPDDALEGFPLDACIAGESIIRLMQWHPPMSVLRDEDRRGPSPQKDAGRFGAAGVG
jgi:hypothetical protein